MPPHTATCAQCGAKFTAVRSSHKLCSDKCRSKSDHSKALCPKSTKVCPQCGTEFTTAKPGHTFCNPRCKEKTKSEAKYVQKQCAQCRREFRTNHGKRHICCSKECTTAMQKADRRLKSNQDAVPEVPDSDTWQTDPPASASPNLQQGISGTGYPPRHDGSSTGNQGSGTNAASYQAYAQYYTQPNYATADAYHPQASGQTFRQQDNAMLPVAPSQPDWTGHTMYDEAGNPTYAGASGFNYQDNHAAGQDPSAWGGDGTDGGDGYWQE